VDAASVVLIDGILARNGWRGGHDLAELDVSMARCLQARERKDPLSRKATVEHPRKTLGATDGNRLTVSQQARRVYDCAIFRVKREILDLHGFWGMNDPMPKHWFSMQGSQLLDTTRVR
jgi:hypothetical protein